jgi:hypothetical protein
MGKIVDIKIEKYRLLVAIRYLNSSEDIWKGLKRQRGVNDFHFLITLRSFIEYARRGIWFLAWADEKTLKAAEKATFQRPESPGIIQMDKMINGALGLGKISYLAKNIPGINEPFIDCLHALTHGNPISVRMSTIGLHKIFNTDGLLSRVELELNLFRVLLYRRMLGEELKDIWKVLSPICDKPGDVLTNAKAAAFLLKKSDQVGPFIGLL